MRKFVLLITVVVFLLAAFAISAQDEVAPDNNLCNEGQLWEGICNSEWLWTCGWYWGEAVAGNSTYVPWWCATQMPAGCYHGDSQTMDYGGEPNQGLNGESVDACSGTSWGQFWGIVFATDSAMADGFCVAISESFVGGPWEGITLHAEPSVDWGFDLGPDGYMCISG